MHSCRYQPDICAKGVLASRAFGCQHIRASGLFSPYQLFSISPFEMAAEASGTVTLPRETIALLETEAVAKGKTVDELAHDSIHAHLSQSTVRKAAKAAYTPKTHLRERSIVPEEAALLFIDVQNYNCHRSGAEAAHFGTVSTHLESPFM